jgi:hypothetical protein
MDAGREPSARSASALAASPLPDWTAGTKATLLSSAPIVIAASAFMSADRWLAQMWRGSSAPGAICQSGAPALDGAALPANYDQLQGGREGQSGRQAHRLDPDGLGQGLCIALLAPIGSHRTSVRPHRNLPRFGGWASIRRALWIEAALAIDAPTSGRG